MTRKAIHLEMKGGKSPRQRIWEAIRANRKRFTHEMIAEVVLGLEDTIMRFCRGLLAAEIIEVIAEERVGKLGMRKTYRLVRDNGVEAPRVTENGATVTSGMVRDAMWGTMHRMFERRDFDCRELASFSSTPTMPVSESSARQYMRVLLAAGYLTCTAKSTALRGRSRPARFMLKTSKYTGPRAPVIARGQVLYDPNEGRVVWMNSKEINDAQ